MNKAQLEQAYAQVSADVLAKQEAEPTCDDEEHHALGIAAHNHMECQAKHRGDHKSKYEYGVRHGGCDSILEW